MSGLLFVSNNLIVKPSTELIEAAYNQAAQNPVTHAKTLANLSQLRNDCSISILNKDDNTYAVACFNTNLPFCDISLMVDSPADVKALISDLALRHPELKEQPLYGLYDRATAAYVELSFEVTRKVPELKMTVDPAVLLPIEFDESEYNLERLTTDDIIQISHLYSIVPAMEWTPKALELGPYYGVFNEENLVSIAGVQFMTDLSAEIGNVVTHFKHRRKNLAYTVTNAVAKSLVGKTQNQFLCVLADNEPAIKLYEKMGFVRFEDLYLLQYYI